MSNEETNLPHFDDQLNQDVSQDLEVKQLVQDQLPQESSPTPLENDYSSNGIDEDFQAEEQSEPQEEEMSNKETNHPQFDDQLNQNASEDLEVTQFPQAPYWSAEIVRHS